MNILSESALNALPTKRLLAYKRKYFPSPNYPMGVDDYIWDCDCSSCVNDKNNIANYEKHYAIVKKVLSNREHIT